MGLLDRQNGARLLIFTMDNATVKDRRASSNTELPCLTQTETTPQAQTTRIQSGTVLVVPALNAEGWLPAWIKALKGQTVQPAETVLVDSESTDRTLSIAREAGYTVVSIKRSEFSHGGTRQAIADQFSNCEIVIYMTQDAILSDPKSIERLMNQFEDEKVGAAYGRQLPRPEADPIEAHARLFNYPATSHVRGQSDIPRLGIKSSFISNSFAAWRKSALDQVGGFPDHTIQNEDAWVASRMIQAGWKVAYCAGATVFHSHPMTVVSEFKRYFDTGVFHSQAPWIRKAFGGAGGEGARFVKSELSHLIANRPSQIGTAMVRTGAKVVAFKLGCFQEKLPLWLKTKLSSNSGYWKHQAPARKEDL